MDGRDYNVVTEMNKMNKMNNKDVTVKDVTVKDGAVKDVTVILPTYNESMNIKVLIERIVQALQDYDHEIIVVDDDSPDKTWQIAEKTGKAKVIRRINQRKLVSAIQKGIDEAQGKYVVWMDADLSMPPEVIPHLLEQLGESEKSDMETNHTSQKKYDLAIASRYAKGGKDQRPLLRVVSSRGINLIANLILNFKVLDYDSGFVAAKKEVLENIRLPDSGYGEYCIEFLYRAGKKYRIKEIPFTFIDRRAGQSKTAETLSGLFKFGMMYLGRIIKLRLKG